MRKIIVSPAVLCALLSSVGTAALVPGTVLAAETTQIEEIVISARKREESLQDVPLAVTAVMGADIEKQGLEDITDLYGRVPGVYFSYGGGAAPTSDFNYISMRGVGFNGGLEPAVGVFIDGMYQPQVGFDTAFLDLERIEVLRGPQGTLFGRNTQAGAINMVTRKPDEEMRGRVSAEIAEFGTYRVSASMSGAIGENLYAGVSAEYSRTDGYIYNRTLDIDEDPSEQITARGSLRWVPNEDLEIVFTADALKKDFNDMAVGVPLGGVKYEALADEHDEDHKDNVGLQLNIDYNLTPDITLTSITGYRKASSDITLDYDGIPTDQSILVFPSDPSSPLSADPVAAQGLRHQVMLDQEFMSEELRLSGATDKLDWLVGLYYFEQKMDQGREFDFGPGARYVPLYIRERFFENRDGWAAFAQGSYSLTDRFELTAGVRYSEESVNVGGDRVLALYGTTFIPLDKTGDADYDNVSFMFSAGYDLTDTVNMYATFAQGWKAGGLNRFPSRENAVLSYEDEKSENWEIGVKSTFFDNAVVMNLSAFWIEITGQQLLNTVPDPNGLTPVTVIDNAADSSSRGFELELFAYPSDQLQFSGNVAYADTEFKDFLKVDGSGNAVDFSGKHFENTPKLTAAANVTYTLPISAEADIELFASYRYVDGTTVADGSLVAALGAQLEVPSYDRLDMRVSYVNDTGWRLSAYVDNLFDSYDYTSISRDLVAGGESYFIKPLEPRQFGLVVSKEF
ncbi:TonB-dependent receptor [Kordiimonas pumila]|uniref:TonB-dependent receptor n=1 Tax=Kordiimonas pumila TaxID=2161677 RepID=A0ABV7D8M8_9PROT|nr:TonB-dependent receptor [Kordiimonas pumila]